MEEELVSFKTAKLAKEKGFNIEIKYYYDFKKFGKRPLGFFGKLNANDLTQWDNTLKQNKPAEYISAPTQSLLQKWLREVHKIIIIIDLEVQSKKYYFKIYSGISIFEGYYYNTYEECLEVALQFALNKIK